MRWLGRCHSACKLESRPPPETMNAPLSDISCRRRRRHVTVPAVSVGLLLLSSAVLYRLYTYDKARRNRQLEMVLCSFEPGVLDGSAKKYPCKEWFNSSFEDNLNVIANYPRGIADKFMWKFGGNLTEPLAMEETFPVLVTAADKDYYYPSQNLLRNIDEVLRPKYPSLKVIYYDIGLLPKQLAQLKKHCRCEVRSFPFHEVPRHFRILKGYNWKPVIVQTTLMEFGFVWWLDSSIRFKTAELASAITSAKANGFLAFSKSKSSCVGYHTDVRTMQFLGEDSCKFRGSGEFKAGVNLYYFTRVTKIVVNAWAACALNTDCMAPPGLAQTPGVALCYGCISKKQDGCCHRFDQSVLSLLYRRLNHSTEFIPAMQDPLRSIYYIDRHDNRHYFPEDIRRLKVHERS